MRQGNDVGTQYRSAIYCTATRSAPRPRRRATRTRRRCARAGYGADHHRDPRRAARSTTPRTTTSSTWPRTPTATAASAAPASPARWASRARRRPEPASSLPGHGRPAERSRVTSGAFVLSFHATYRCARPGRAARPGGTSRSSRRSKRALRGAAHAVAADGGRRSMARRTDGARLRRERAVRVLRDGPDLRDPSPARPRRAARCRAACSPRVCLLTPRGVCVTLSHYCPTAADLLFAEEAPPRIVTKPAGFPGSAHYEGLDARHAPPPLLRPGVWLGWDGYERWSVTCWRSSGRSGLARRGARPAVGPGRSMRARGPSTADHSRISWRRAGGTGARGGSSPTAESCTTKCFRDPGRSASLVAPGEPGRVLGRLRRAVAPLPRRTRLRELGRDPGIGAPHDGARPVGSAGVRAPRGRRPLGRRGTRGRCGAPKEAFRGADLLPRASRRARGARGRTRSVRVGLTKRPIVLFSGRGQG